MTRRILGLILIGGMLFLSGISAALAADYKVGDKVEANIQFTWYKATIVKVRTDSGYDVVFERPDGSKETRTGVSNWAIRPGGESERQAAASAKTGSGPRLGQYDIYAYTGTSITALYLGHFMLTSGGQYKVSQSNKQEDYFGKGEYSYDAKSSRVKWLSGPYKEKGWSGSGKFEISRGGKTHSIEIYNGTYGFNSVK